MTKRLWTGLVPSPLWPLVFVFFYFRSILTFHFTYIKVKGYTTSFFKTTLWWHDRTHSTPVPFNLTLNEERLPFHKRFFPARTQFDVRWTKKTVSSVRCFGRTFEDTKQSERPLVILLWNWKTIVKTVNFTCNDTPDCKIYKDERLTDWCFWSRRVVRPRGLKFDWWSLKS